MTSENCTTLIHQFIHPLEHMNIYMPAYTCTHMYKHIYIYIQVHTYIHTYIYAYVRNYKCSFHFTFRVEHEVKLFFLFQTGTNTLFALLSMGIFCSLYVLENLFTQGNVDLDLVFLWIWCRKAVFRWCPVFKIGGIHASFGDILNRINPRFLSRRVWRKHEETQKIYSDKTWIIFSLNYERKLPSFWYKSWLCYSVQKCKKQAHEIFKFASMIIKQFIIQLIYNI